MPDKREIFEGIGDAIELRKNPVTGGWVIVSTDRAKRPMPPKSIDTSDAIKNCPFCPGNEPSTPPEAMAYRDAPAEPDTPGWRIRVFPNKFPALKESAPDPAASEGLYEKAAGFGVHEVIVETPSHDKAFPDFGREEIKTVFECYRDRLRALRRDERLRYAQIFKNHGLKSGASILHEHSQILALPFVPVFLEDEIRGAKNYFDKHGRCVFCDIAREEAKGGERLVFVNEGAVVVAPFAGQYSFETWVMPRAHSARFEDAPESSLADAADALAETLRRLKCVLGGFSFNMVLHTAPFRAKVNGHYHWHFEITTRFASVAGFERGTGVHITAVPPEFSAKRLRES